MHLTIGAERCSELGADRAVARISFYRGEENFGPKGRSLSEARRVESGGGERVQPVPSPPAMESGCAVSSPSGVQGGAPAAKRFSRVLNVQSGLSMHIS